MRTLARRLLYYEAPDVIPGKGKENYARAIASRISGEDTGVDRGWTTLPQAIEEARELLKEAAPNKRIFPQEHLDHLTGRLEQARGLVKAASTLLLICKPPITNPSFSVA